MVPPMLQAAGASPEAVLDNIGAAGAVAKAALQPEHVDECGSSHVEQGVPIMKFDPFLRSLCWFDPLKSEK